MKRKIAVVLFGLLAAMTSLAGCGNNEATEAASESAQTEDEGAGDDAEMQEAQEEEAKKQEKEEKKAEKKAKKEARKEEENKDKEEKDNKDKEASEEMEEEAEEPLDKVAVLLPNTEEWADDAEELKADFAEDGYEALVEYAADDVSRQVSQIQEMLDQEVKAFVITPVDPYGLTDILASVKEAEIPVFSYDELIMETNAVKYYTAFGGRKAGQMIAEEIIEKKQLKELQKEKGSMSIEFLMGSQDDVQALFLYNGVMEGLQPYFDDGTLVCTSGKTSFDDTGILRWSSDLATTRLQDILDNSYEEDAIPDIICTGFDQAALAAADVLEEEGIIPGTDKWPMITGVGCEAEAVKAAASGRISFSLFMDYRELADRCEQMVYEYLDGEEDPEVNDYEQYDNGVKIIGSYLCEPQVINGDNFELLIDNGYYEDEEVRPEATPTPTPEATPTPSPEATPGITSKPEEEEDVKSSVTLKEEEEEKPTPSPTENARVTLKKSKS